VYGTHDPAVIPWLTATDPFPPVSRAMRDPNGLLAAGGDLSVERLLDAYVHGIFPWFSEDDPLLWWSPDPRMVLYVEEVHVSRSLRRRLRAGGFRITVDAAFRDVMLACAEPRREQEGTWITHDMVDAYTRLASLGYAHSIEVWMDEVLAGGLYGVAIGRMFYGESMFARRVDASKIALVALARQLARWGFVLIDCQMSTPHLQSLGAREIPRPDFLDQVSRLVRQSPVPLP
jgi:leucyl/phenylalanyl-tRNA---protein transferase